jgi:hypothetical protein
VAGDPPAAHPRAVLRPAECGARGGFDPETAGPTALAAEYRRVESTLLDRWDAPLVNDFLCMIAFGASRNLLEKWLGPEGLLLHNDVMIGQGDIVSAEPAQRIARMGRMVAEAGIGEALARDGLEALDAHPAIGAEVQSYLDRFGDRCTEELKLESIPLGDDPAACCRPLRPAPRAAPCRSRPADPDWKALFPKNPVRRRIAKALVTWTKARVRDRENLRFERTRIFGYTRRVFLALGREFAARGLLADPPRRFLPDQGRGPRRGGGLWPVPRPEIARRVAQGRARGRGQTPRPAGTDRTARPCHRAGLDDRDRRTRYSASPARPRDAPPERSRPRPA